jgi:hypothetical protein
MNFMIQMVNFHFVSLCFQTCFAVWIHSAGTWVLILIGIKLRGWKLQKEFEQMSIIYLPVIIWSTYIWPSISNNFEIPVLKSRGLRMQLFCMSSYSRDEMSMDDYYLASSRSALRHRSNLSHVIATVKITTWRSISSSYYSSEHCISPYENEQSVLHKFSRDSHAREHKIFYDIQIC